MAKISDFGIAKDLEAKFMDGNNIQEFNWIYNQY
jgi:hypothetical protein